MVKIAGLGFGLGLGLVLALAACKSKDAAPAAGSGSGSAVGSGSGAPTDGSGVNPELPAAKQLEAWLAVFNTADEQQLVTGYTALFVQPDNAARDADFSRQTGGFTVRRLESTTMDKVVALLQERRSEQFAQVELEIEAAAPYRIKQLRLHPVPTPDELAPARLTEAGAIDALKAELDRRTAADQFAGAVLIAKDGAPVFAQAYGLADRTAKTPNTPDTKFRIGSMNKMFTATAIMRLVQDGKLALDAPLASVLPDYPNKDVATKVTIQHLLNHTGGTGDIFTPEYDAQRLKIRTISDYLGLFGKRALLTEPGTTWAYSNYGFILLGAVIEKLTAKTYYDAVQELVFAPAGMTATSSPPEDTPDPRRAHGYTMPTPDAGWNDAAETLPYRGTSAGGGLTTVADFLAFANALRDGKLLDPKHYALLTTRKDAPGNPDYAYGFADETLGGVRCVGHGGGAPGMNGDLAICDSGYTIVVLSNLDPPAAGAITGFIRARLPAK